MCDLELKPGLPVAGSCSEQAVGCCLLQSIVVTVALFVTDQLAAMCDLGVDARSCQNLLVLSLKRCCLLQSVVLSVQ